MRRAGDDHVGPLDAPLGTGQVAVGLAGHQTALRPSGSHLLASLSMSLTDVQVFQDEQRFEIYKYAPIHMLRHRR